jgi:tetratricopeptide (TPR) repeat protein
MDEHLQRALVLFDQSRPDLAEKELALALAADPDDPVAHSYLALCLREKDDLSRATEEAQTAVRLAPDWAFPHYVLSRVHDARNRMEEAEAAIREALRLNPENASFHAVLASLRLQQRDWEGTLQAAEKGLECDAEHVSCNNIRAMALTKLGRAEEASATIARTLARDPEDAFSHANQGWTSLHQRDTKKALEHFREALRLNPELTFARAGLVEALKARNPIYALMLRYFLWMGHLSRPAQWGILLGGYFGYRLLGDLAERNPALAPWLMPLLVGYIVFAVMTWVSGPLFNLLLRLNRYGRYALSEDQSRAAQWVGGLLVPALGCLIAWLITDEPLTLIGALYFGLLLLPVSALFNCDKGWPRNWMTVYTLALASTVPLSFALVNVAPELARFAFQAFLIGSFLSGFVANYLMTATVRR